MKKIILGVITGVSLSAIAAFTVADYVVKDNTAEVYQYQQLAIFADSRPVKPYKVLGEVSFFFVKSYQYRDVRDRLINKAKKEFGMAQGLIMRVEQGDVFKADVITFDK